MKTFIIRVVTFSVTVALAVVVLNAVYVRTEKTDYENIGKFWDIPCGIKVCNLGSSHGMYSFQYDGVTDEAAFNFGLSSQTLSYDKRILEAYRDHIDEGAAVFIVVSYHSFFGIDEEERDEFLSKNKRYYQFLPRDLIKKYDFKTDIYTHYLPVLSAGGLSILASLLGKSESAESMEEWELNIVKDNIDISQSAKEDAYTALYKDKIVDGQRVENDQELTALYDILDICRISGFRPVLVTTPFTKDFNEQVDALDSDFYPQFQRIVQNISSETGVKYMDFSHDEDFSEHYAWFFDSNHLCEEGARYFTSIILSEINGMHLNYRK